MTCIIVIENDTFKHHGVRITEEEEDINTRCLSAQSKNFIIYRYLKQLETRYQYDDIFYGLYINRLIVDTNLCTMSDFVYACLNKKYTFFFEYLKKRFFPTVAKIDNIPKHFSGINNSGETLATQLNSTVEFDISKLILDHKALVAGSYVLSYQLGNIFTGNDVDIYINESNLTSFIAELKKHALRITKSSYYAMKSLKYMCSVSGSKIDLQIMVIDDKLQCNQFIVDNFDFDFCCVQFDGATITIPPCINLTNMMNGIGKILPTYIAACKLVSKKNANAKYRLAKTLERTVKYNNRGFQIENIDELLLIAIGT